MLSIAITVKRTQNKSYKTYITCKKRYNRYRKDDTILVRTKHSIDSQRLNSSEENALRM